MSMPIQMKAKQNTLIDMKCPLSVHRWNGAYAASTEQPKMQSNEQERWKIVCFKHGGHSLIVEKKKNSIVETSILASTTQNNKHSNIKLQLDHSDPYLSVDRFVPKTKATTTSNRIQNEKKNNSIYLSRV